MTNTRRNKKKKYVKKNYEQYEINDGDEANNILLDFDINDIENEKSQSNNENTDKANELRHQSRSINPFEFDNSEDDAMTSSAIHNYQNKSDYLMTTDKLLSMDRIPNISNQKRKPRKKNPLDPPHQIPNDAQDGSSTGGNMFFPTQRDNEFYEESGYGTTDMENNEDQKVGWSTVYTSDEEHKEDPINSYRYDEDSGDEEGMNEEDEDDGMTFMVEEVGPTNPEHSRRGLFD